MRSTKHTKIVGVLFIILSLIITSCSKIDTEMESELDVTQSAIKESEKINSEKIIVVIDEWAPYTSEYMTDYGIASKIVSEAMKAADIEFEFQFRPWARAMEMVKFGDAWGSFPWFYTEERSIDYLYSEPVIQVNSVIFYKKDNPKLKIPIPEFKSIYDLKEYKFGGVFGYYYEKEFEENGFNYDLSSSLESAFKLLDTGKVDIINEDEAVGRYIISRAFTGREDEFAVLERAISTEQMYMVVNKTQANSEEILKRFNEGLEIIRKNGIYDQILESDKYKN